MDSFEPLIHNLRHFAFGKHKEVEGENPYKELGAWCLLKDDGDVNLIHFCVNLTAFACKPPNKVQPF